MNASEDGDIVAQLSPASLAAYREGKSGSQTIKVYTSAGTQILESSASLPEDGNQLLVIAGALGNYAGYLIDDSYTDPADNKAKFRIEHAAVGVGALDAYLTSTAEDITQVNATVNGLGACTTRGFVEVSTGTYKLRLTPTGSKEVVYESDPITLANKQVTTFLAYPTGSGKLVDVSQLARAAGADIRLENAVASQLGPQGLIATLSLPEAIKA